MGIKFRREVASRRLLDGVQLVGFHAGKKRAGLRAPRVVGARKLACAARPSDDAALYETAYRLRATTVPFFSVP